MHFYNCQDSVLCVYTTGRCYTKFYSILFIQYIVLYSILFNGNRAGILYNILSICASGLYNNVCYKFNKTGNEALYVMYSIKIYVVCYYSFCKIHLNTKYTSN